MISSDSFINRDKKRGTGAMSYEKLFAIKEDILKIAASEDLSRDLHRAVEKITAGSDNGKTTRSFRREIIELIRSIEMIKIQFLLGEVRAKDLHREVEFSLQQFRLRHQNFDYRDDPIFNSYF
jgi:hypothetical protein